MSNFLLANKPIVRIVSYDKVHHVIGLTRDGKPYHYKFETLKLAQAWVKAYIAQ